MYTWILVFYSVLEKKETLFQKLKRDKVTDYVALTTDSKLLKKCENRLPYQYIQMW